MRGDPSSTPERTPFRGDVVRTPAFVEDAVNLILGEAAKACRARGEFRLSLCGGGTPKQIYKRLATLPDMPWDKTLITFGDERCVPPEHERSNYRMAMESFLKAVPIPAERILRMEGERPPAEAARHYEEQLKAQAARTDEAIFTHDLILLGMGDDGHTASLFPGTTALEERERWVVANEVAKFEEHRITFTYPLINAARHVCFLITGENKRPVYERIFAGGQEDPAARVSPVNGRLTWMIG